MCGYIRRVTDSDAHLKFEPYHDKAFPLFLPPTREFAQTWLAEDIPQANEIDELLEHPRLYGTLQVEEVKTFKSGVISPNAILLEADKEGSFSGEKFPTLRGANRSNAS